MSLDRIRVRNATNVEISTNADEYLFLVCLNPRGVGAKQEVNDVARPWHEVRAEVVATGRIDPQHVYCVRENWWNE